MKLTCPLSYLKLFSIQIIELRESRDSRNPLQTHEVPRHTLSQYD